MASAQHSIDGLKAMIGHELGVSEWHRVDQQRVSGFAEMTEDFQFIHIDPDRAAATPFGSTIAHGFLPLSLLSVFFLEAVGEISGAAMSMNYGFDSVRFINPVHTGKRVRGRFLLEDCVERKAGQWKLSLKCTIEIEGEENPALVANWLVMLFAED